MTYDSERADRFRKMLKERDGITEKRMMGGVCFFHNGNMIGGADRTKDGDGRFMFRVGKDNEAEALSRPGSTIVEQAGRRMGGLVFVDDNACDDQALSEWGSLALAYVTELPPK